MKKALLPVLLAAGMTFASLPLAAQSASVDTVRFTKPDGVVLTGIFTTPSEGGENAPAVVLVPDGSADGDALCEGLAAALVQEGMTTLRYYSGESPRARGNSPVEYVENGENDASRFLDYLLLRRKDAPTGVFGYRTGAYVAMKLSAGGKTAFMITLDGPDGNIDDVLLLAARISLEARGCTDREIEHKLKLTSTELGLLRSGASTSSYNSFFDLVERSSGEVVEDDDKTMIADGLEPLVQFLLSGLLEAGTSDLLDRISCPVSILYSNQEGFSPDTLGKDAAAWIKSLGL